MKRLLFLGDSLTDCRRLWLPEYQGLGDGYVYKIRERFASRKLFPLILNKGHDGFTIQALLRALDRDCLAYTPDLVTILAGINNIGMAHNTGISLKEQGFASCFSDLLRRIKKETQSELLLMGPFIFPHPQEYTLWMEDIAYVEQVLQDLADQDEKVRFLPLNQRLNEAAGKSGYLALTTDGIHLTGYGHDLLADIWWTEFSAFYADPSASR